MGATQRLIRAVGKSKAMEMILGGVRLTAAEAQPYGLVSRVVPQAELMPAALKLANSIAGYSLPVVAKAKDCIKRAMEMPLAEGIRYEQCVPPSSWQTSDPKSQTLRYECIPASQLRGGETLRLCFPVSATSAWHMCSQLIRARTPDGLSWWKLS